MDITRRRFIETAGKIQALRLVEGDAGYSGVGHGSNVSQNTASGQGDSSPRLMGTQAADSLRRLEDTRSDAYFRSATNFFTASIVYSV